MAEQKAPGGADFSGGLNEAALAGQQAEDPGGTGGSSGSGTVAGKGYPSGGTIDHIGDGPDSGASAGAPLSLARALGEPEATEAAVLGSADGGLADAAGAATGVANGAGPVSGETVGAGAGRGEAGAGTPADRGGLGGAGPLGHEGGTGPAGTASPGGNGGG